MNGKNGMVFPFKVFRKIFHININGKLYFAIDSIVKHQGFQIFEREFREVSIQDCLGGDETLK